MNRLRLLLLTASVCFFTSPPASAAPEAFETGPGTVDQLPRGKEADGILGDFVLRNNRIEAVISANQPNRKANMSAYWNAIAPGCLFDLTLRDQNNDQLTIFSPCAQEGPVSFVRIVHDGADGVAEIETVTTAANHNGLYVRHAYRLRENWQGLQIITTLRNESAETKKGTFNDRWTTFTRTGRVKNITWADAVDPADKTGYAFAWMADPDGGIPLRAEGEIVLEPGASITFARALIVASSPATAFGIMESIRTRQVVPLVGAIKDQAGNPVPTARVDIEMDGKTIPAYPDADGEIDFPLPAGEYPVTVVDPGRPAVKKTIRVAVDDDDGGGAAQTLYVTLEDASRIVFDIRDELGESIPCKAQFRAANGTQTPDLGPENRAHGCKDQYFSETGQFTVPIDPGTYRVIVTHGIEYGHLRQTVQLEPGATVTVRGTLKRLVDTAGWISADYHNHSTPSGDNTCGTDDRIISLAVEQIEFAPTTEHNRLYDWRPHIQKLGLTRHLSTIAGIELTGSGAHFNSFPFEPHPHLQDGGAPLWKKDPRLNAINLRNHQGHRHDRWIQINHPDMVENFIDHDNDGHEDGGYPGLSALIDGAETWGLGILKQNPYEFRTYQGRETLVYRREFIWLQMLNRGHRYWCVAVSDAHSVHGDGVGAWRTYLPSSTDAPAELDWQELSRNSKAGRMIVTSGPFLEVTTEDGTIAGGSTRGLGGVKLHVKVQCTDWIDIDRVQILVNGRQPETLNFTRQKNPDQFREGVVRFDRWIDVPLSQDAHLIAVAYGEEHDLSVGFGSSRQASYKPCAYNNPIFVDIDGDGFEPNGDTLGWPLPVKGMTIERAKELLKTHAP